MSFFGVCGEGEKPDSQENLWKCEPFPARGNRGEGLGSRWKQLQGLPSDLGEGGYYK